MGKKRKKRGTSSLDGLPQQMVFKFPNSNNKKNKKKSKNNNHHNKYKKNQSIIDDLPQQMVFKFPNSNNKKNKKESKNNNHNNEYKKNQSIIHGNHQNNKNSKKRKLKKTSPETVKINKSIAVFASRKQLNEAVLAFNNAKNRGLANSHTYAATINAYVRCGDVASAEKLLASMNLVDIVSYTTVIKGLCNEGRLNEGLKLADKMLANRIVPNVRTGNTLLRGCILIGKVSKALDILHNMEKKWEIIPDASSWEYVIALLCRGLKIEVVNTMVGRLKAKTNNDLSICNNPALYLCMCRCNAILGRWKASNKTGKKALLFLKEEEEMEENQATETSSSSSSSSTMITTKKRLDDKKNASQTKGGKRGWGSQASSDTRNESLKLFKQHRRHEMREEIEMMLNYVKLQKEKNINNERQIDILISFLKRTCVIPLVRNGTLLSDDDNNNYHNNGNNDNSFPHVLCDGLYEGFGLKTLIAKYSLNENQFLNHFTSILDNNSEKINLKTLMYGSISDEKGSNKKQNHQQQQQQQEQQQQRPVKIEICSGAGEWVVSQAKNDPGSDWVSMEIRHDRIYQIFCRSMFDNCHNLSIISGDASIILPLHIQSSCAKFIFVNYPEPPQQKGEDHDSQSSHLLSGEFFKSMANALTDDGIMTILTDNEWYAKFLLKIVDNLNHVLKSSTVINKNKDYRVHDISRKNKILLYEGLPGIDCGVANINASSYFDRLWQGHQQRRRFFLALSKQ